MDQLPRGRGFQSYILAGGRRLYINGCVRASHNLYLTAVVPSLFILDTYHQAQAPDLLDLDIGEAHTASVPDAQDLVVSVVWRLLVS